MNSDREGGQGMSDMSQASRSGRLKRAFLIGAMLLVLAVGGLATTTALGVTFQGSGDKRVADLLLTENRHMLEICVDAIDVDSGLAAETKNTITDILPELEKHPVLASADVQLPDYSVEIGCPSDAALLRPGASVKFGAPAANVDEASRFRLFVFVLSDQQITDLFGDWPARRVPQETLCEGGSCVEVTTGLYLSASDLEDETFVKDALVKGIGLEPAVPLE